MTLKSEFCGRLDVLDDQISCMVHNKLSCTLDSNPCFADWNQNSYHWNNIDIHDIKYVGIVDSGDLKQIVISGITLSQDVEE